MKTMKTMKTIKLLAYIFIGGLFAACSSESGDDIQIMKAGLIEIADLYVINKSDRKDADKLFIVLSNMLQLIDNKDWVPSIIKTIAIDNIGIDELKDKIFDFSMINALDNNKTIVTNQRHYEQLKNTLNELELVIEGLNNGLSGDLLAINIKQSLFHLGLITGEVSTDDLLSNIFGKFCIGK